MFRKRAALVVAGLLVAAAADRTQASKPVICKVKVVDTAGKPIGGAEVVAFLQTSIRSGEALKLDLISKFTTSSDAVFSLRASEPNSGHVCMIAARKPSFALGWAYWRRQEQRTINIVLKKPSVLRGEVVDEKGNAAAGAEVRAISILSSGDDAVELTGIRPFDWLLTRAGKDGKFRYDNIPPRASVSLLVTAPSSATTGPSTNLVGQWRGPAGTTNAVVTLRRPVEFRGIVVGESTRKPLPGVNLLVESEDRPLGFPFFTCKSGADGSFVVNVPRDGVYYVRVWRGEGRALEWGTAPRKIEAKRGTHKKPVALQLLDGGTIEVVVTDAETKEPVRGAWVSLGVVGQKRIYPFAYTGGNGMARIRLAPARYLVTSVAARSRYSARYLMKYVTVTESTRERIEVQLKKLRVFRGLVRDRAGKPIGGAKVTVVPGSYSPSYTGMNGRFEVKWDPSIDSAEKAHVIVVQYPKYGLAALAKAPDHSGQVTIQLQQGFSVFGRVATQESKLLGGTTVQLDLWTGSYWTGLGSSVRADERGRYEINAIPHKGKFRLWVHPKGYSGKQIELDLTRAGAVVDKDRDFVLDAADMTLSGVVVDEKGTPLKGVNVTSSIEVVAGVFSEQSATTDASGKFVLRGLPPGRIRIDAEMSERELFGHVKAKSGDSDIRIILRRKNSRRRGAEVADPPRLRQGFRLRRGFAGQVGGQAWWEKAKR